MRFYKKPLMLASLLMITGLALPEASADKELKNLTVLDKKLGKKVGKGMKALSKGLGVKCVACHVKGDFDSDKVENKGKAREFLKVAMLKDDKAARAAALTELLKAMQLDKAKDEKQVWKAIDTWKPAKPAAPEKK